MKLKFDLDPSPKRALIVALLLFFEALFTPLYAKLQEGSMPEDVQFLTYIVGAIIVFVTYLLGFVKGEEND